MGGTKQGGKNAAATNKRLYGPDFYAKIGKLGGARSRKGGFAGMPKSRVSELGRKGGLKSRRGSRNYA